MKVKAIGPCQVVSLIARFHVDPRDLFVYNATNLMHFCRMDLVCSSLFLGWTFKTLGFAGDSKLLVCLF